MIRTIFIFLISATTWGQTIKGIYTINPLKGLGDSSELSDLAKKPVYFSYIYSNRVSLQQLQSMDLKSIDTTYFEAYGESFQKIDTVIRPSKVNLYKNYTTDVFRLDFDQNQKNVSIEDNIPRYHWKLEDGSKIIAGYSCKKATAITTKVGVKQNIVAWYCEDIPIEDGLRDYNGLPGLIMEVEIDDLTRITFEKIVIDAKENIDIPTLPKINNSLTIKEFEKTVMDNR